MESTRSKEARKITLIGFITNVFLVAFKLASGIMGKSGAMLAYAIHSLSDILTDITVLISLQFTSKSEDRCRNYGRIQA